MAFLETWADNDGVRIHYIDSKPGSDESKTPLLYVPPSFGGAEDFRPEMLVLSPRRCVAVSLRGRGKSEQPMEGYSFESQVADIEAVADFTKIGPAIVMGFSMSVPLVLSYAVRRPEAVKGVIVLDYPARYPAIPDDWPQHVLSNTPDIAPLHVLQAIQRDSREVLLWDDLRVLRCPVLIVRGQQPGALLDDESTEKYVQQLGEDRVRTVVFEQSGHELWEPEYDRFIATIQGFVAAVDHGVATGSSAG